MGGRLLEGPTMVGGTSDWKEELGRFLRPFLDRLGHKAWREMCPLYVSGLIGPGDGKSIQPMASRLGFGEYDQFGPLADKFGQPVSARIGLVAAFLAGVTIFRKVLRIPLLLECERGELESLMTMAIEDMTRAPKRSKVSNSRKGFPDE